MTKKRFQSDPVAATARYRPEAMGPMIRQLFRAMVDRIESQFDGTDLILSQWLTLKLIGGGAITCVGDVGRELGIETGASTRLVDQLENRGYLVRRRSETDRRIVGVTLSDQGRAVVEDMQPRLVHFWRKKLDIFSEAERDLLFAMLRRLHEELVSD